MRKPLAISIVLLLLSALLGIFAGRFDAQEEHENQPSHCSNAKAAKAPHKCDCKKTEDACDMEDQDCKVYCRKHKCYCFHPACDS